MIISGRSRILELRGGGAIIGRNHFLKFIQCSRSSFLLKRGGAIAPSKSATELNPMNCDEVKIIAYPFNNVYYYLIRFANKSKKR